MEIHAMRDYYQIQTAHYNQHSALRSKERRKAQIVKQLHASDTQNTLPPLTGHPFH